MTQKVDIVIRDEGYRRSTLPPFLTALYIQIRQYNTKLTSFVLFSLPRTRAGTETRPYDFG